MSEWRRVTGEGGAPADVGAAADAVLALLQIDEPTKRQHVGAFLVGGALIKMNRF